MWKKLAELHGWDIPEQEMERLAQGLETLHGQIRVALDRDLSTVEPMPVFRPGDRATPRPK